MKELKNCFSISVKYLNLYIDKVYLEVYSLLTLKRSLKFSSDFMNSNKLYAMKLRSRIALVLIIKIYYF